MKKTLFFALLPLIPLACPAQTDHPAFSPKAGTVGMITTPSGLVSLFGVSLPVGVGVYVRQRWYADVQAFIPTNHIFNISARQKLHSDRCAQASLRWYTTRMAGHKFPFFGRPRRYYIGVDYWYRQRGLTRYKGFLETGLDTATGESLETHYSRVEVKQSMQGGSLHGGVETCIGSRLMLNIQVGLRVFGWENSYGELQDTTIQYGGFRESLGFSTTARPGTGGAAMPHLDVALTYLLNP